MLHKKSICFSEFSPQLLITKQAEESFAAAMSLNSIVTSWADDYIETTDFKLLQPSTGKKQHGTCNLYSLTFAIKGKP